MSESLAQCPSSNEAVSEMPAHSDPISQLDFAPAPSPPEPSKQATDSINIVEVKPLEDDSKLQEIEEEHTKEEKRNTEETPPSLEKPNSSEEMVDSKEIKDAPSEKDLETEEEQNTDSDVLNPFVHRIEFRWPYDYIKVSNDLSLH